MKTQSAIFIVSMIFAPLALADDAIRRCIQASGQVLLTDRPCAPDALEKIVVNGRDATSAPGSDKPDAPPPLATPKRPPGKRFESGMGADIATLKQARINFLLLNEPAPHTYEARLANLP